jgi:HAD superfamily hydrolase (TIGR01493 family)
MTGEPLDGIHACVFDAYGTLFDVASAALRCADELAGMAPQLSTLWRDKQLQYTWLRAVQDRHADFWQVTGDALDFALESLRLADPSLLERLMRLYLTLDAHPDVPAALRQLRDADLATAILSKMARRRCSPRRSHMPGSAICSTICCRSRMPGCTSRTPVSTSSQSTASPSRHRKLPSSRRTVGTPGLLPPLACARSGATGKARPESGYPALPTAKSTSCLSCHRSS